MSECFLVVDDDGDSACLVCRNPREAFQQATVNRVQSAAGNAPLDGFISP